MEITPPKLPKIMEKKYLIYRVLIAFKDGTRSSHGVEVWSDNLDEARKEALKDLGEVLQPIKHIFFHYHERIE